MVEFFGVAVSTYTIIMFVFLILLLAVVILGDVGGFFDVDGGLDTDVDTGLSPVSLPVIGVFGMSFGAYGTLFETLGLGTLLTPLLAVASCQGVAGPRSSSSRDENGPANRTRRGPGAESWCPAPARGAGPRVLETGWGSPMGAARTPGQ